MKQAKGGELAQRRSARAGRRGEISGRRRGLRFGQDREADDGRRRQLDPQRGHEGGRADDGLALGEKRVLVVACVVVMIRVALMLMARARVVAVAVMSARRLHMCLRVAGGGIAVRLGGEMHRHPHDVKHQRADRQPAGGGAERMFRLLHAANVAMIHAEVNAG